MTVTDVERQRRILLAWEQQPDLDLDAVSEAVDLELQAEAQQRAEAEARSREFTDSLARFWACRVCGVNVGPGVRDCYCDTCRAAAYVLRGMAALDDKIGKQSRRQLIEADLAARQAAG